MPGGALVVSIDFEHAWGNRRNSLTNGTELSWPAVDDIVRRLLEIMARHDISATWAMVGHLMLRAEDCPDGSYPYVTPVPRYSWFRGDWFAGIPKFGSHAAGGYYTPHLVEAILQCRQPQEIGCHTFSHITVNEADCDADVARAEFTLCQQIARDWGLQLDSVVFPRNVIGHLPVLEETGFKCYRAKNSEWYWFGQPERIYANRWFRYPVWTLRYLDERLGMCPPLPPVRRVGQLWEIPHSMFFAGRHGVSQFVPLQAQRTRALRGLRAAADTRRVFSLYTHPQNFLGDVEESLAVWEEICREAARLRSQGDLEILTMGGMAAALQTGGCRHWLE